MRFRHQHDGSLTVPARGVPPPAPPGFVRDPRRKYYYIPILAPCDYREQKTKVSSCCGTQILDYCAKKEKYIIYSMCMTCDKIGKENAPTC